MLDLSLFRKPAFAGASIVAFAISASSFAMLLYLTLYLQNVLGFSPLETGVRVLPITLLAFAVAPFAGKLSATVPVRALMGFGLALAGLGLALMHGVTATSEWTALLGGFLFVGAGIGIINPVLVSTAVGVVPPARSGMASGINNTFRQLGVATGIAGFGAIFQARITDMLDGVLASAAPSGGPSGTDLARWAATGQAKEVAAAVPPGARPRLAEAVPEAFVSGLNQVFLVGSTLAFAGAVLAVILIRRRDFVDAEPIGEVAPAPA
jgi:MFS family permease